MKFRKIEGKNLEDLLLKLNSLAEKEKVKVLKIVKEGTLRTRFIAVVECDVTKT